MKVLVTQPKARTRRIRFLAPEDGANLAALDETPLEQPRVDIGECRLKALSADLAEYSLRQSLRETPCEVIYHRRAKGPLYWIERLLLLVALAGLGTYGWFYAEARVSEAYESWRLDQIVKHRPADLKTFLSSYLGGSAIEATKETPAPVKVPAEPTPSPPPAPLAVGMLIGRIEIPRLSLSTVVLQGDSDQVLRKGVGHIPSTALPGESGNVAIAGHRDTFFRALKDIRQDDNITLATTAETYHYRVDSVQIVKPNDTQVLAPSGQASLTLITCYPFYFVGSAPKRYIVHAQQIEPPRMAQQPSAATVPPTPEPNPDHPSPHDQRDLGTAHADSGENPGMDGKRVLNQLKMRLRVTYPLIWQRMQVCENAILAQLQKEREWFNARVAAAVESFMDGDD